METLIRVYKSSPHTSLDHATELDPNAMHKTEENPNRLSRITVLDTELSRRVSGGKFSRKKKK
jgi:hypothetical protein